MKLPFKKTSQMPAGKTEQPNKQSDVFQYEAGDAEWVESLDTKIEKSKSWWDEHYKLEKKTKQNRKVYLGEQADDDDGDDDDNRSKENRVFAAIRTMVATIAADITEPEVYPSSTSISAKRFAEDLEKALYIHADAEKLQQKVKFAVQDAIILRRGYLKPRYDAVRRNFCAIEYVPPESIIVDHKAKSYEELRYFRHILDKSVSDLLIMFPDMRQEILQAFGFDENTPKDQLDVSQKVHEDWCFVPDQEEGLDLIVTWSYKKLCLGKMRDPNWRYGKTNFLDYHMMPLIEFSVLNDGKTHIDETSFIEQAQKLQENLDERKAQISKNAGLGNTGMPVVDSAALADDQSQYLTFDEDTVLELDVSSANGQSINDVFTTWQAAPMPQFVYEDMLDTRSAIDNTFGAQAILQGQVNTDAKTLGENVLLRDNANGRLQEAITAIDNAMDRLYKLVAQFLLVYGDEKEMFRSVGENSEYDYVLLNSDDLDTYVTIRVKSGTSMPVDRSQRRAVANAAAPLGFIDPLTYWEIMDEANAQKYAKRLMDFKLNPAQFMEDADEDSFDRDAYVDIEMLKNGATPPFRTDLTQNYFAHLNSFLLSGDMADPRIPQNAKAAIVQFIQMQLARGKQKFAQLQTQINQSPENPLFDKPNISINYKDVEDPNARAALLQLAGVQTNLANLAPTSPAILESAVRGDQTPIPPQDIPGGGVPPQGAPVPPDAAPPAATGKPAQK